MVKNIFTRPQTSILSAATILAAAVAGSRLLGLLRDRLLASTFFVSGSQWQLDVYFAAFRIPDLLFQLLILGALSAAFIPVFSRLSSQNSPAAWTVASTIINAGAIVFFFFSLVVFAFTPDLCRLIAPNFGPAELTLMVNLTRIMLLAQMFFIVSNILTGILQSHQRFLIPALAPIAYNGGIILGIIFLAPSLGIYGAAAGVVFGAFMHFIIQLPLALHLGFAYQPILDFSNQHVRRIMKLMLPRTLALGVTQVELTVAVLIATSLSAGSLSIFYFAQHLYDVPIALFGLTIGQAALPILSLEATRDIDRFQKTLGASLRQILYLSLPASILILVLRVPIVRLVLGAKNFPWEATILTGQTVAIFSFSIAAQAMVQILVRGFYALQNTKIPFFTAASAVVVNVIASFIFVFNFRLGVLGLALATSISSIFHTIILLILLNKQAKFIDQENFLKPVSKIFLASLLTGFFLWFPMRLLDKFILDTTRTINLILLTVVVTFIGLAVYVLLSFVLRLEEFNKLCRLAKRFGAWREILSSSGEFLDEAKTSSTAVPCRE